MEHGVKIFSGSNSLYLSDKIAENFGKKLGKIVLHKFKDGEFLSEIQETVRGEHVFFIQSTNAPMENLVELLLMIDAAKRASAYKVIAVIPYYGFARQDRKDKPRVSIGSKLVANMLVAAGADRIITMDLHASQIQGFFDIPVDHLEGSAIFTPYIQDLELPNLTFAAPDVGSAHRVREIASLFAADMVICDKYRQRANEVSEMVVIGDVSGKDIIIIDDICDTGGTLAQSANLIKKNGSTSVRAFCTHAVLSENAIINIENSAIEKLIVTDTLPINQTSPKLETLSTAKLFAQAIRNAWENKSINSLFMKSKLQSKLL